MEHLFGAYGWDTDYVNDRLTEEQLLAYLDAAAERFEDEATAEHESMIEAVRAGTIFAHERRQYDRWRSRRRRTGDQGSRGLTGAALESAIMGLAVRNPEYVILGGA